MNQPTFCWATFRELEINGAVYMVEIRLFHREDAAQEDIDQLNKRRNESNYFKKGQIEIF